MAFAPAIGAIISGIASLASGVMAYSQAKVNAQIAEDNATRAVFRGQVEAQDQDTATLAALGEQEALQGGTGLSVTGRSAMLSRKASREIGRRDALNVQQGADIERFNYQVDAVNHRSQGMQALIGGIGSGIGGIMQGVASGRQSLLGQRRSVRAPARYGAGSIVS